MAGLFVTGWLRGRLGPFWQRLSTQQRLVVAVAALVIGLLLWWIALLVLVADGLNLLARRIERFRQLPVAGTWAASLVFVLIAVALAGGGSGSPQVVTTPTPSLVAEATATVTPTAEPTPIPSPTPVPTATQAPTPTPTPLPTATPEPTEVPPLAIAKVSLTATVSRGSTASVTVKTAPGAYCTIDVVYKSGSSTAAGLDPKSADGSGKVSWSWKVGTRTTPGTWPIYITCETDDQYGELTLHFKVV